MRKFLFLILFIPGAGISSQAQFSVNGKVQDENGAAVSGAVILLKTTQKSAISDSSGRYSISGLPFSEVVMEISLMGFASQSRKVNLQKNGTVNWELNAKVYKLPDAFITATRADDKSAMAHSSLGKEQIGKQNLGQDLPFLLNSLPSVVVTSDAGNGVGYSGIRVRGSDPTRINVTINGVPFNDAESHGVYWVNMPDFASSVNSIQLQRGVGTSANGAGAFGASLNMITDDRNDSAYAEVISGGGSFNTLRNTLRAGTGNLNGFFFNLRLSQINSDGYIDRAKTGLKSFFTSAGYEANGFSVKANVFSGIEKTYLAWDGVPEDSLTTNRTYNPSGIYYSPGGKEQFYNNQTDNYQQDHYQLFFDAGKNKPLQFNLGLHYTRGRGYYEQYRQQDGFSNYGVNDFSFPTTSVITPLDTIVLPDTTIITGNDTISVPGNTVSESDLIRRRWLDNHFYGAVFSLTWLKSEKMKLILGGGLNRYSGSHYGEVIWAQYATQLPFGHRYYENDATKTDASVYLKGNFQLGQRLNLFADLQVRQVQYSFLGYNNLLQPIQQEVGLTFFNPKAGLTLELNELQYVFTSLSVANREPVRDDYTQATKGQPQPERLIDWETGYRYKTNRISLGATAYYMMYKDQLVLSGQLNDVGANVRINVPESYRAGVELEAGWNISRQLNWMSTLALSSNKAKSIVESVPDWDSGGDSVIVYTKTDLSFSPSVVASSVFTYQPYSGLSIALTTKYVGDQYLDNTQSDGRKIDAFLVNDFRVNWKPAAFVKRDVEFVLSINNFLNEKYAPNGYTYSGLIGGQRQDFNYYYPQAGINFLGMVRMKF